MDILSAEEAKNKFKIDTSNYIHDSVIFVVPNKAYGFVIGTNNYIMPGAIIHTGTGYRENTVVGNNNFIGSGATISSDSLVCNSTRIENACYIGFHACIQNYSKLESSVTISNYNTVGSYSYVGSLSPVIKDVKPFSKVFGNPCGFKGFYDSQTIKEKYDSQIIKQIKEFVLKNKTPEDPYLISVIDEFKNQSRKKVYDSTL